MRRQLSGKITDSLSILRAVFIMCILLVCAFEFPTLHLVNPLLSPNL